MSDLTTLLESEASAEIDAILSEANARAEEIMTAARAEAETIRASKDRAAQAQRDALRVRADSAARLEASALRLRAQHEAVESVLAAVADRLDELAADEGRYERVLEKLLAEAVAAVGAELVTGVEVHERDLELATTLVRRLGLSVPVTPGDVQTGVRVRAQRGGSVEHTLHGRLAALRDELAAQVGEVLFAESPTEA